MRKCYIALSILLSCFLVTKAQEFSNKGRDFWLGYGYHQAMTSGNSQDMVLYFATDVATSVTVAIPGIGYTQTYNIGANTVFTSNPLPKANGGLDARLQTTGIENKGIHITATQPIVAYAHLYNSSVSGSCVLLPTPTLGTDYYSINYTNNSNSVNANCWFYVVATEPGTTSIEITPSATLTNGWVAGVTQTITLQQGEIFNGMGTVAGTTGVDLTGTLIKSVPNNINPCKRIGVFSGSGRIYINCAGGGASTSSDNYMVQGFPRRAWGQRFLTSPTGGNMRRNIFRICVSDPATVVKINGVVTTLPLINNFYYDYGVPAVASVDSPPLLIEGDRPITVAQYITTQGACNNGGPGDPEVIYLSSVEQNIDNVLFNSNLVVNGSSGIFHFVNAIVPNRGTGVSSFRIDGNVPTQSFTVHPGDPNYSYITINGLAQGQHRLTSDSGFNSIAYGFGQAESYGYNAGTNVRDLNRQLEIATTYGIENAPNACKNSPFNFRVYLPNTTSGSNPTPLRYDSIKWEITPTTGVTPNNFPYWQYGTPKVTPDSITIRNGKEVAWYSIPNQYSISTLGNYDVKMTLYDATVTGSGCSNTTTQEVSFELAVTEAQVPTFATNAIGCYLETAQFTETTSQTPKPTYRHYWDFGDPASGANNTSTLRNPTHIFSAPGTYNVKISGITTAGCLSDTVGYPVIVPDIPNATIAGTTNVCLNAASPNVTITITDGVAPFAVRYAINGVEQTPTLVTNTRTVTIPAPTNVPGPLVYSLIEVRNVGSTLCVRPINNQTATVTINPPPVVAISAGVTVCQNAPAPIVTFTGSGATAPYIINYTLNGVPQTAITTNNAGLATVSQPTNTAGVFNYAITTVTESSASACVAPSTATTTITVSALPTATISGTANVCQNAVSPQITFTASGGVAPYTFTYNINNGANQTLTTATGNSVTLNIPTNTVTTFTYNLVSVREGSAQLCTQNQTGSAVVTIRPLPTATILGSATVCLNSNSPNVVFKGANSTGPYTFSYRINGGAILTAVSGQGDSAIVPHPTNVAGTFIYTLVNVTDASSTACTQSQSGSATIVVTALPTATISGVTSVCQNATNPNITFTGANGTAPYTFTYNINGGTTLSVSTTGASSSVTVAAPTTAVGNFTYNLLGVTEGGPQACAQNNLGASQTITVNPLPTATIATSATSVCLNGTQPAVTFTGASATAPYTFSYRINGGTIQTITTAGTANTVTLNVPTNVAGTFTYSLVSVRDASSTLCENLVVGTATIVVQPLPTMGFNFTQPTCDSNVISFTDITNPNAGTITSWNWNFGDPTSANNTSTDQNPSHLFTGPGTYIVSLTVVTSNTCTNPTPFTRNVVVSPEPFAGFIVPEVCINDAATVFTDTSRVASGSIVYHYWNFGDPGSGANNTSNAVNGTHLYSAIGPYLVTHAVRTAAGCVDTVRSTIFINAADPVSNFDFLNATSQCSSDSVQLRNLSTVSQGSITKLEIYWDVAGEPTVFETVDVPFFNGITKHKYPTSQTTRTYQVRVIAYTGAICFAPATRSVTVLANPLVQFDSIPRTCLLRAPFNITQGTEIGGVAGAGTYTGPGIIAANGLFNPQVAGIGTHRIVYTFTSSSAGACKDSAFRWISVLDTASARFTFSTPTCLGTAVTFTSNSTAPAGIALVNEVYDFGDGSPTQTVTAGTSVTHNYSATGFYTVTMYTTSNPNGCVSNVTRQQLYISPIPTPQFSFDKANYCLPNDNQVRFINTSSISDGSALTYSWNFGDPNASAGNPNTSTAFSPTHSYSTVGPFAVTLVATSVNGCAATRIQPLTTVRPQPKAQYVSNKPNGICIGDNVTFTDVSVPTPGSTTVSWNWEIEPGIIRNSNSVTYTFNNIATFAPSLYIVNSWGCVSDTFARPYIVYKYPSVELGPTKNVLEGGTVQFNPTVSAGFLSYLWSPSTYLGATVANKNAVASLVTNDITYKLTVTGEGGCTASDDVFVKVLRFPQIPNTFTPNSDGINDLWKIENLNSYPECRVQVFTRAGQVVFESVGYGQPWDGTFKGKSLPIDTYYYVIEPGNGRAPLKGYVTILK
jgi:gliding motility-associated-like protein